MKRAVLLLVSAALGCGSSSDPDARLSARMCTALADRFESRLQALEADRSALQSWATSDPAAKHALWLSPTLNDALATYQAVWQVGGACRKGMPVEQCPQLNLPLFLADLDGGMRGMRALLDGMRGRGPCAPDRAVHDRRPCDTLRLHLESEETFLDLVRPGWEKPLDDHGASTDNATVAAGKMAFWRALVDYGLAAAPACAPAAAASCEHLRVDLAGASPDELVRRMRALGAAYGRGTSCPANAGAVSPSNDAGPPG